MSIDGNQPPPSYAVKDNKFGPLDTSPPLASIPIVMFDHGISSLCIENVRKVIADFFQLPIKEKRKFSRKPGSSEGYGTDIVVSENQVLDWSDRFSLRIFPENQRNPNLWPLIRDAFFANLGDQLQIMSNGIYKSPMHRVVTNMDRGKISIAMFNEPDPSKEIGPMKALINEDRPRLYKTFKKALKPRVIDQ
uniref:jasmonate-induced oxygenase 4-like n=1 Tax=Erigeron canadensis TaxID=72917 RepID=UPI001CB8EC79|nr:jasmonate-induced oxygenase 4-like [Erigeron canadensis]